MLWFCLGTAGELIKIYPLLRLASEKGLPWRALSTGQSAVNFWKQWDQFKLPRDQVVTLLKTDDDLHTAKDALKWFTRANLITAKTLRKTIEAQTGVTPGPRDFWLVHGDTLSTLLGARIAKKMGVPLVHIEAGLRSPLLLKPFPEEITRRMVSRFARYHFPQDQKATQNLKTSRVKGQVVCTQGNTLFDAIQYVARDFAPPQIPSGPYIVANVHRFENLTSAQRWKTITDVLARAGKKYPVLLVLHPPTLEKLNSEPETKKKLEDSGVKLLPRQSFTDFIPLLKSAQYVISDGGSNQEECYYLGKPCLILRDSTERVEGLDQGPCVLTQFDPEKIDTFLEDPKKFERAPVKLPETPSDIILKTLYTDTAGGAARA